MMREETRNLINNEENRKRELRMEAMNLLNNEDVIPMDLFSEYVKQMHENKGKRFIMEYKSISNEPLESHNAAILNKSKNRFDNIFPYDNTRVQLSMLDGEEDSTYINASFIDVGYINASFIDGYSHKNAYIAAQGPMPNTITDFWRMIWEHKLNTIVMLTRAVVRGKRKCEVYWGNTLGSVYDAGAGISVHLKQLLQFPDYKIRVFCVTNEMHPNIPPLEITHFQFLSWPDHGVPQFTAALINFIRRIRRHHIPSGHPLLVHCSAGVGRTGSYILLDAMLDQMEAESSVSIFTFLCRMRAKRPCMVQTLAQYVFVHDALEELIVCGDTCISSANLRGKLNEMVQIILEKGVSGFSDQFELLNNFSGKPSMDTMDDCSDALQPHNQEKNRYLDRVPYNEGRVRLRKTGETDSDYINASFINGYKHCSAYLATQAPLKNTQCDFWRMVWEWKSMAIIMLCGMEENGEAVVYPFWPEKVGLTVLYGKCSVTLTVEGCLPDTPEVILRQLKIEDDKNTSSHTTTLYHVTEWPEKGRVNPSILLHVMDHLTRTQQKTGNQAITVMCNDGVGRTGTFICIHAMLEQLEAEGVVDFIQFIKSCRMSRPGMVSTQEHLIFCHEVVAYYIDSFDT